MMIIIIITLCLYANCQGASKAKSDVITAATLTAAMPTELIAQVNADVKAATDVAIKSNSASAATAAQTSAAAESYTLQIQKAALRSSLSQEIMPDVLMSIVQEFLYPAKYKCVDTLNGHTGIVVSIVQLKDGRSATASWDSTVRIWDLNKPKDQQCVDTLKGHTDAVASLLQLSDGRLATASYDGTVRILDLTKPEGQKCVDTLNGHTSSIKSIVQLADGRLATASRDRTVCIWAAVGEIDLTMLDLIMPSATVQTTHNKGSAV